MTVPETFLEINKYIDEGNKPPGDTGNGGWQPCDFLTSCCQKKPADFGKGEERLTKILAHDIKPVRLSNVEHYDGCILFEEWSLCYGGKTNPIPTDRSHTPNESDANRVGYWDGCGNIR